MVPRSLHFIRSCAEKKKIIEVIINIVQIFITRLCIFFFPNGLETCMVLV